MRTSASAARLLSEILVSFVMLGMNSTLLSQVDVTQPGDPIVLVNGANDGDADAGPPPFGEGVEHAIDNLGGKLGSFDRLERELGDGESWSRFDRGIDGSAFFGSRAA